MYMEYTGIAALNIDQTTGRDTMVQERTNGPTYQKKDSRIPPLEKTKREPSHECDRRRNKCKHPKREIYKN